MNDEEYLTPDEVVQRYKNTINKRTLANWRSSGEGPKYTKIGGRVLYPLLELINWEKKRTRVGVAAMALIALFNNFEISSYL